MCIRDRLKTLANYIEEAGYETAYIGKWHLASDGELEKKPTIDHTVTAVPQEYRGGYTGFWRAADVLEFTSHGYDGFVFDENNNKIDFKGYRADCINDFALEYLDQYKGEKPFFMTVSQIEPHHQNDHKDVYKRQWIFRRDTPTQESWYSPHSPAPTRMPSTRECRRFTSGAASTGRFPTFPSIPAISAASTSPWSASTASPARAASVSYTHLDAYKRQV